MSKTTYLSYFMLALLVFWNNTLFPGDNSPAETQCRLGVIGLAKVTLIDSSKADEFETFIKNEYHPLTEKHFPGMRWILTKGDRGKGKGDYMIILTFDTAERREAYYPVEGKGFSADANKIFEEIGGPAILTKFYSFAKVSWLGDYRVIE